MKSDITINDINLMKFYKCQQRGMLSMKKTSVFDLRNEVSGKGEMFRIPSNFVEYDLLKYKIYKSIFFKMFQTLFKEKKVNYSQLKKIAILITEKTIINNKKLASNLSVKQEDYDEVKQHIFNNLENLINLDKQEFENLLDSLLDFQKILYRNVKLKEMNFKYRLWKIHLKGNNLYFISENNYLNKKAEIIINLVSKEKEVIISDI